VHPFDMDFQFLRLAELATTEIAERPTSLRVSCASVGSMHLEVVQAEEELHTAIVGSH